MRRLTCVLILICAFAAGCNTPAPAPPFKPVADVKQLMAQMLEPAADLYWDAVGTIIDGTGQHEIAPKTIEEWEAVRNNAVIVAESGNLLMMSTRAKDNGEWMRLSQALVDTGAKAIRAAEGRNTSAVFDAGAEVYDACTNCHVKYSPQVLRPNATQ
jgi:hypothetical protein